MTLREYERDILNHVNDSGVIDAKVKPVIETMLDQNVSNYKGGLSARTMAKHAHFEAALRKLAKEIEEDVARSLGVHDAAVREAGRKSLKKALMGYYQKLAYESQDRQNATSFANR